MKNKLNNEERLLRDKLNQAEAEFNYQEGDWLEIQQQLPKKGALSNYSPLLKAGFGFAFLVAIAYLINTSWNDSAADSIAPEEGITTELNTASAKTDQASESINIKTENPSPNLANSNKERNSLPTVEKEGQALLNTEKQTDIPDQNLDKEKAVSAETEKESSLSQMEEEGPPSTELKSINLDGKACVGSTISLSPIISGENLNELKYIWKIDGVKQNSNETTFDYSIQESGMLKIELTAMRGKKIAATHEVELDIPKVENLDFTYQDVESPYDDFSANFTSNPEGLENLKWKIKGVDVTLDGNTASYNFGKKGVFDVSLIHTAKSGCTSEVSKPIFVKQDFETLAPNVFTPDGNDLNEAFIPVGFTPEAGIVLNDEFRMSIYDYNGKLVYTTTSNQQPWNGRLNNSGNVLPEGTYVWKVELRNSKGQEASYAGKVKIMN